MRQRSFYTLLIGLQLVFCLGITSERSTGAHATGDVEIAGRGLLSASGPVQALPEVIPEVNPEACIGCGYTPDAPAPGVDIPRCSDVLCLVQGLLDRRSLIYVERDIDISGSGALPDVTSEVTIMGTCSDGAPCKIDARGASQMFIVGLDGYLTLKDLEITGAFCERGSAVTVSGSGSTDSEKGGKLVAFNVKFTRNIASEFGGALNIESGGVAYIQDCVFRGNKAVRGGAVFVGSSKFFPANIQDNEDNEDANTGRVTCALTSCTTFVNTEFTLNSADFGGAVYVDDAAETCKEEGGAKIDCTTCAFHRNRARKEGGAVFVNYQSSGAITYLRKSRFTKNSAEVYGGDVATQEGQFGSRGAQLYAYQVAFTGSTAPKGRAVAVKPFSVSTFARCDFAAGASLQCEGSCDTFCPSSTPLLQSNISSVSTGPNGESCPDPPAPLCSWIPAQCRESLPPPFNNTPSPTSSPPAIIPPPSLPPVSVPPPLPPPSEPPTLPPESEPPTLPPESEPPTLPPTSEPPASPPVSVPPASPPAESPSSRVRGRHPLPPAPAPVPVPVPPPVSEAPSPAPSPQAPPPSTHSRLGGKHRHRHNNGSITGDPHFVGKHGERFDFHGKGGRDYCIVSDKDLHINMHVFKGIHRRTTFISKIGVLYKTDKVLVDAQANKVAAHLEDQWQLLVNDAVLSKEETIRTLGGLEITHLPRAVLIRMRDELDVNVTVMPSGSGRFGSGANYLDFQINKLRVSSSVHGVLGQTYQESSETYQKIKEAKVRRLKRGRAAAVFMDGSENDYLSSSITAPDCRYSAYIDQSQLRKRVQRMVLESAKALFRMNKQDQTVSQCTGFGHSLCLPELED